MPPELPESRPHCYGCDKPVSMCLCGSVPRLANKVGIHVLQHAREKRHAIGTVRLLRLGLEHVKVYVLRTWSRSAATSPIALPPGAGLLYPSANAIDLETLPADARPEHLVVIDGTWAHAHRIYRDNPWIQALPHYQLSPVEGSRYRIRTEPRQECLSTLEAVVQALHLVEPDLEGTEGLLTAFDGMIDAQIDARDTAQQQVRIKKPRKGPSIAIPRALWDPDAHVIVVYAEAAPGQSGHAAGGVPLRIAAATLDGARTFDALVRPQVMPDAYLLDRMGLAANAMDDVRELDDVLADFRAFCTPEASAQGARPTMAAWGPWTLNWLAEALPDAEQVSLKGAWANVVRGKVAGSDAVVSERGIDTVALPLRGRAADRLGRSMAIARQLVAKARDACPPS